MLIDELSHPSHWKIEVIDELEHVNEHAPTLVSLFTSDKQFHRVVDRCRLVFFAHSLENWLKSLFRQQVTQSFQSFPEEWLYYLRRFKVLKRVFNELKERNHFVFGVYPCKLANPIGIAVFVLQILGEERGSCPVNDGDFVMGVLLNLYIRDRVVPLLIRHA